MRVAGAFFAMLSAVAAVACAPSHEAARPGRRAARPERGAAHRLEGVASWYGRYHHGRRTASGEIFDMHALTAAHRTLPLGTRIHVTNLANGRTVAVRVNDRGPYAKDRVLDVSFAAARALGFVDEGVARVRIDLE